MAGPIDALLNLFGDKRKDELLNTDEEKDVVSFTPRENEDGAAVIAAPSSGSYGSYLDLEGSVKNEAELVTKYREIAQQPELDYAIDDIINEAMATDEAEVATINLDDVKISDNIKKMITDEFDYIKNLMNFDLNAYNIFRNFYVDGRIRYHAVTYKNWTNGIVEMRYIDPRKIRRVREIEVQVENGIKIKKVKDEYFLYSEKGFAGVQNDSGLAQDYSGIETIKIKLSEIVEVNSGILDKNNTLILGYLQKSIKPLNQLRILEDNVVIYRISRAPERRIFYIDVGNLPKAKADQYLRETMLRHKNKHVYDASSGQLKDDRKFMTMTEDYFFPRQAGGRATEVVQLQGGQNLGEMTDVEYFQKKLYRALNIPFSRLEEQGGGLFGRQSEISRDEVKFSKFIGRIRKRFAFVFIHALRRQLILKGIMNEEEFNDIENDIHIEFAADNFFTEMKDTEILNMRLETLKNIDPMGPYVGKYFSVEQIRKDILRQTDEEIKEIDKKNDDDKVKVDLETHFAPDDEEDGPPPKKKSTSK